MQPLSWYLKRLSIMSPGEVVHRIGEQFWLLRLRRRQARFVPGAAPGAEDRGLYEFCSSSGPVLPEPPWSSDAGTVDVDSLLSGGVSALGFSWRWRPEGDIWLRAPDTGDAWPDGFFADIDYRHGNPYGDIRILWEPARLQHLVVLALVAERGPANRTGRAVALIEDQIESWAAANPPYRGPHYVSAMECGLRLIALCHALDMTRAWLARPERTWSILIGIVRSHASFILRRLSLHSSAGNHTVAECAALVYAGALFPEMQGAGEWRRRGLSILRREAQRQVVADGGGIEQAFRYHVFVLDLLELVQKLLVHLGDAGPAAISEAVSRGRTFLDAVAAGKAEPPAVGDADNGFALSPYLKFGSETVAGRPGASCFPDSGYSVVSAGDASSLKLLFDHGPLGMAPAYGHGHADALSVLLYDADREILSDAGAFTYTGETRWRRYFRGTAAHNTVTVDGIDQAEQQTSFQWTRPFRCNLVRSEHAAGSVVRMLAWHDGYVRSGVRHWRGVVGHLPQWAVVWDFLEGEGEQRLDLHWHGDRIGLASLGDARRDASSSASLQITGGAVEIFQGSEEPLLGWRSPVYGQLRPTTTIRARYCGALPHEFVSVIALAEAVPGTESLQDELDLLRQWVGEAATD